MIILFSIDALPTEKLCAVEANRIRFHVPTRNKCIYNGFRNRRIARFRHNDMCSRAWTTIPAWDTERPACSILHLYRST